MTPDRSRYLRTPLADHGAPGAPADLDLMERNDTCWHAILGPR